MNGIASVRATRCRVCPTPCEQWAGLILDPKAACPIGRWSAIKEIPDLLASDRASLSQVKTPLPGSELKKLLARFGFFSGSCACDARATEMDVRGPDWCEKNIDTIVGWLREEAEKRMLPFAAFAAEILIRRAISKARRG